MFPQLEEILFPIMQAMCSEDGQDVFEEILEMIAYFTYFSPEVVDRSFLQMECHPTVHMHFCSTGHAHLLGPSKPFTSLLLQLFFSLLARSICIPLTHTSSHPYASTAAQCVHKLTALQHPVLG